MFRESPLHKNAPLSAAVESDVVGYSTIDLKSGYEIVAIPFLPLDEEGGALPIQSITGELLADDRIPERSDSFMVLDTTTHNYVNYRNSSNGWIKVGEDAPTTEVLPAGTSICFKKSMRAGKIIATGKVNDADVVEIPLARGYSLVSNPFPTELKIADIVGEGLTANAIEGRADRIMVYDSTAKTYTTHYLHPQAGWTLLGGDGSTTTAILEPCQGFVYLKSYKDGKLTFNRPF